MPMDSTLVSHLVRTFVAKNFLFSERDYPYGDDASFLEEGVIDSLGIMELVSFVEKQFAISVADHEILPSNFDSVTQLSQFINGKMANGS